MSNFGHHHPLRSPQPFFSTRLQDPRPEHLGQSRQLWSYAQYPSENHRPPLVGCPGCYLLLKYASRTLLCYQETCSSLIDQCQIPPLLKSAIYRYVAIRSGLTGQASARIISIGALGLRRVQISLSFSSNVKKILSFVLFGHDDSTELFRLEVWRRFVEACGGRSGI